MFVKEPDPLLQILFDLRARGINPKSAEIEDIPEPWQSIIGEWIKAGKWSVDNIRCQLEFLDEITPTIQNTE